MNEFPLALYQGRFEQVSNLTLRTFLDAIGLDFNPLHFYYVGRTSESGFQERWDAHAKEGWKRWYAVYETDLNEDAISMERFFIAELRARNFNLRNQDDGGTGDVGDPDYFVYVLRV